MIVISSIPYLCCKDRQNYANRKTKSVIFFMPSILNLMSDMVWMSFFVLPAWLFAEK